MKYRLVFCLLIIFLICGCSKDEEKEGDDYLSLSELLATQRSTENGTKAEPVTMESSAREEVTMESSTREEVTMESSTREEVTMESSAQEEVTMESSDDKKPETTTVLHNVPTAAPEPEKVVVYQYVEVPVTPRDYFFCDTWVHHENTLVFSPREIYYSNGSLHATMYVYNGHDTTATNIHDIYLSFDNGTTSIATANFDILNGCSIDPGCYVLWDFTFPPEAVHLKNTDLCSINTTYKSTYNY